MKTLKITLILITIMVLLLSACGKSEQELRETFAAELTQTAPTVTPSPAATKTPKPTSTPTLTSTPSPTSTQTPLPTKTYTPTPSPTPEIGTFKNPATVGMTVTRFDTPLENCKMSATLQEIIRGAEANKLAKQSMGWPKYETPFEGQEYIAIRVKLDVLFDKLSGNNTPFRIYPTWHLFLRYYEAGPDDVYKDYSDIWGEGYPPLSGEGWVFFKIREGVNPYLYFQPKLMIVEPFGFRTHGAYFSLETPQP